MLSLGVFIIHLEVVVQNEKMKSGGRNPDLSAGAKIESCNQPKTTLLVFSSPSCSLNWQRCPARPC
jgi:hypothetical protein